MSIISHTALTRLFKTTYKPTSLSETMPRSAQRAMERSNESRQFNINRDVHGSRPWHSYASKQFKTSK